MNKILPILLMCFLLQGCSLLKIATAPFKNTVLTTPKQTDKSQRILKCKGEITVDDSGKIVSCSSGFYSNEKNYTEKERKLTFFEKLGQLASKTAGWIVWAIIISIILVFMGLGGVVSVFWSSAFGMTSRAFKQVVKGIQNARKNNVSLSTALDASTDESTKQFIAEFKLKNNIK